MSNCMRCHGLYVWDWDEAVGASTVRCLNCSHRPLDPPLRDPIPHGRRKPSVVGDLTHCPECGKEKVEWRQNCTECSRKKLKYYQRKRALEKISRKKLQARLNKEMSA